MAEKLENYFTQIQPLLPGNSIPAVRQARLDAMGRFSELGFPTTKHEEWKYTSVLPLIKLGAHPVEKPYLGDIETSAIASFAFPGVSTNTIVILNGRYSASHSTRIDSEDEFQVSELFANEIQHPLWNTIAKSEGNAFISLNTALAPGGIHIEIPKGKQLKHPVHIIHVTVGGSVVTATWSRILVVMNENSSASILETHHTVDTPGWETSVAEVSLAANAMLNWTEIQNCGLNGNLISHREVNQAEKSQYQSNVFTFSGSLVRNNQHIHLKGQHSEALLHGLYLLGNHSHCDNHTLVDHAVSNCHSNELYKGVVAGNARGVFNGKILVRPDAQKTLAYQSNKNLLLSATAEINTKPQLEIFADDVKCSHGATTGRLDTSALFYLRSRGISESVARGILTQAFAAEVAGHLTIPELKEFVLAEIEKNILAYTS
jgi:Fe-S cluster assembly protein SufD